MTESSEVIPEDELALIDEDAAQFVEWFVGDHAVSLTAEGGDSDERLGGLLRVERGRTCGQGRVAGVLRFVIESEGGGLRLSSMKAKPAPR